MGDVPPGNIVAMLDTAYEESFYDSEQEKQDPSKKTDARDARQRA
jgi:hypothetical protein